MAIQFTEDHLVYPRES